MAAARAGVCRLRAIIRGVDNTSTLTSVGGSTSESGAGATVGTVATTCPTGCMRLMRHERYRTGRSATNSVVRTAPGAEPDDTDCAVVDPMACPVATIWYSDGTVSRSRAVA